MNDNYLGEVKDVRNISQDDLFLSSLSNARDELQNEILDSDYDVISNYIDKFNNKLYKNPTLIFIGYIVIKKSLQKSLQKNINKNKSIIDPTIFLSVTEKDKKIKIIMKENNISAADVLRYSRYIELYIPEIVNEAMQ